MAFLSEWSWWLLTGLQVACAMVAGLGPGGRAIFRAMALLYLGCLAAQWGIHGFSGFVLSGLATAPGWRGALCSPPPFALSPLSPVPPGPEELPPAVVADLARAAEERKRYWDRIGELWPEERVHLMRRSAGTQELRKRAAVRFLGPDPLVRRIGLEDAQVAELAGLIQGELGPVQSETIRYFLERLEVVSHYVEWRDSGRMGELTLLRKVIHGGE
jgi:hypothetical protein